MVCTAVAVLHLGDRYWALLAGCRAEGRTYLSHSSSLTDRAEGAEGGHSAADETQVPNPTFHRELFSPRGFIFSHVSPASSPSVEGREQVGGESRVEVVQEATVVYSR